MESERLTIEREELYCQVWAEPIFRLAPKYGISHVALKKICKKLNVPTPPRGYWAKIQNHIRVERAPLPKIKYDQRKVHELNMNRSPVAKSKPEKPGPTLLPEALEVIERIESWPTIKVPRNLRNAHPLVKKTLEELSGAEPDKYAMLRPWGKEILDVRVSHRLLKRAMRIMQALLTRIEYLGFPASAKRGYHQQTTEAVIFDEAISFGISEKSRQIDHVLTDSEKKDIAGCGRHFDTTKWDYEPTGLLSLRIDAWAFEGIRKKWNDGKLKVVEDGLREFLVNLVTIADLKRQRRLEDKERERLVKKGRPCFHVLHLKKHGAINPACHAELALMPRVPCTISFAEGSSAAGFSGRIPTGRISSSGWRRSWVQPKPLVTPGPCCPTTFTCCCEPATARSPG